MNELFQNIQIKSGTGYFLYIGEIKGFCLNQFLREPLSRAYGQEMDCIAIVPDVMETYPEGNFLVINPAAAKQSRDHDCNVSCRIPGREFATAVSNHPRVIEIVKTLISKQNELAISMFQSLPEMTLQRFPGVRILGPEGNIANKWNSKLFTYESLNGILPIPDFRICNSREDLLQNTRGLWNTWRDGIFLSLEYSAAGAFSFLARSEEELLIRLGDWQPPYLITRFFPHEYDPTVLAVVANENDVYIGGIADQQMADLNKFTGSIFPSVLPSEVLKDLKKLTVTVGRALGRTGYRGIFGCDYILDKQGDLRFVEVNARKQGTTMEMCCNLENSLPEGCPSLLELEYSAVTENSFPAKTRDLPADFAGVHWGTYNLKMGKDVVIRKSLPPPEDERFLFKKIAGGGGVAQHIVLEHIGADFILRKGGFLGRVISLADDRRDVLRGLEEGKNILEQTIEKETANDIRAKKAQPVG